MAVAAAERLAGTALPSRELIIPLAESDEDRGICNRAARFIGAVAVDGWHIDRDGVQEQRPISSLYDAVQLAAAGNPMAKESVRANVATDVIERTIKAGHVSSTELEVDDQGGVRQYGQSMRSVQANSLRYASDSWQMRERVEAETRNTFRIEHYRKHGLLRDYRFVVLSRAADNMSETEMADAGFFTDTMSCAIQVTSENDGRLVTESAFVAGRASPDGVRHDKATIKAMLASIGVDIGAKSAAELLDTPLLIHKDLLPDGAINLVEMYDEAAGSTFFGQNKPRQDYLSFRERCREREAGFQPEIDAIVDALIAAAPRIDSPVTAIRYLDRLSGKHMIEHASRDTTIDPMVFGRVAAGRIEYARWQLAVGNRELARIALIEAIRHDRSTSCPTGLKKNSSIEGVEQESNTESVRDKDDSGDCDFVSKECPMCKKKDVKTVVKKRSGIKTISGSCGCKKVLIT